MSFAKLDHSCMPSFPLESDTPILHQPWLYRLNSTSSTWSPDVQKWNQPFLIFCLSCGWHIQERAASKNLLAVVGCSMAAWPQEAADVEALFGSSDEGSGGGAVPCLVRIRASPMHSQNLQMEQSSMLYSTIITHTHCQYDLLWTNLDFFGLVWSFFACSSPKASVQSYRSCTHAILCLYIYIYTRTQ